MKTRYLYGSCPKLKLKLQINDLFFFFFSLEQSFLLQIEGEPDGENLPAHRWVGHHFLH